MNPTVERVTQNISKRSHKQRQAFIANMRSCMEQDPPRKRLSCGNLAHGIAACSKLDKQTISQAQSANLGIITAYNDMLSAHQPYASYPDLIKLTAQSLGATAQVAGAVPAMCDGITQGQAGMELSLFSRDVVAMATAIGLSHNMFDGNLFLGICDKIVPGMLIGALQFAHLPAVFVPAGPMPSGIPNKLKAEKRQLFAEDKINKDEMLEVESASYHSPGTCTFYGTANSNQMLMELLGVQLAGASFVQPGTPLREALTRASVEKLIAITAQQQYRPLYEVVTEASLVNALVGLLATGGSTNHSLHLISIARAAGIHLTWEDMDELSTAVPLLARIYPNGEADVNQFQAAGGMANLIYELRSGGHLNEEVVNIMGEGLDAYCRMPELVDSEQKPSHKIVWEREVTMSSDVSVLAPCYKPFAEDGGLRLLKGNIGQAIIKISAVAEAHRVVEAPCRVFDSQDALKQAFQQGELFQDVIAVVRFQGPAANGMPELHKMTPLLGIVQDRGFKVALLTDGRMSGASGKVPAAIHLSPEACKGGLISKIEDGDVLCLDANKGSLDLKVDAETLTKRQSAEQTLSPPTLGRDLFGNFRSTVTMPEQGADVLFQSSTSSNLSDVEQEL
jgi:phosphogluconate dehydratase